MRGILLDLDGTLADSLPALYAAYLRFLAEHDRTGNREEFASLNGPALREVVTALRERHGLPGAPSLLEQRYQDILEHTYATSAELNPGARELVRFAADRDVRLALVTAAPRRLAQAFLDRHGLGPSFSSLATADSVARGKPDPALYHYALKELGLPSDCVVAVEDSANGVRAAAAAGVRVFLLNAAAPQVPPELRDFVAGALSRLDELPSHLARWSEA